MSPFWCGLAEMLSQCGRSAHLFIWAIIVMGLSALFWERGGWALLVLALLLALARTLKCVVMNFRNRDRLPTFPPLSRHDLQSARSKLLRRYTKR